MNLQFQYPWVLLLLWLIPVIGVAWHLLAKRYGRGRAFVSEQMAAKLAPPPAPVRNLWQLILLMSGLLLAVIAAARPQWGMKEDTVYQRGRDLMILLDVSRSMLARDVHPSRLGRAKADLQDLIKELKGDRVGLIAFRARPLLLCPLTTDYGFLSQTLEGADVDSAPAGETDIGDAVLEALRDFQEDEGSHKAIVLVSDGDDLAGKMAEATSKAKEKGVAVFTVGFGSTEGAPVPSAAVKKETMSFQGQEVVSKLNHEVLRDLAEQTGGAYVPVGLANVKLGDLYRNHLSRIRARDLEESVQRRAIERYQWFLFPGILCFLAIAFLSRGQIFLTRPRTPPIPGQHPASTIIRLMVFTLGCGLGVSSPIASGADTNTPPGREGARLAQRHYLTGRYDDAAAAYQAAARTAASANRDPYLFNAGCAMLKAGKADEAAELFRSLTGTEGELGASAAYNLGCALFEAGTKPSADKESGSPDPTAAEHRVQSLKQSGTAFQKAIRLKSGDEDSRKNLAVVAGLVGTAEEQAKITRLMAEYGQTQPGALADMMLLQQRQLIHDIPAAFTNTTPALIDTLEALALEQDKTADLMIPLKGKLLQALSQPQSSGNTTNMQQQMAMVSAFAEAIRDGMFGSATALRNLDRAAYPTAAKAEESVYTLWKGIAGYPQLLREDIRRQTNAIALTAPNLKTPSGELCAAINMQQSEAINLTGLFRERFEQTVPPEGITRPVEQTTTNQPAGTNATETVLSKEDRAKIIALAGQAITAQTSASQSSTNSLAESLPHQRRALDLLKEIEKLLPKDKQPQNQQQQKDQNQDSRQNEQPQPKQEQPKPQQQPRKEEPRKGQLSPEDLKRLLEKAKQREQEHEQEKRERDAAIPMSPAERDW